MPSTCRIGSSVSEHVHMWIDANDAECRRLKLRCNRQGEYSERVVPVLRSDLGLAHGCLSDSRV